MLCIGLRQISLKLEYLISKTCPGLDQDFMLIVHATSKEAEIVS